MTSLALAFKIEDSFNALSEYDTHERVKQHLLCLTLLGETQNSSQNFYENSSQNVAEKEFHAQLNSKEVHRI